MSTPIPAPEPLFFDLIFEMKLVFPCVHDRITVYHSPLWVFERNVKR